MTLVPNNFNYTEVLAKAGNYIESEGYKGFDPYDTLNSWVPFHWLGKWGRPIATQIQKRNPINIRPVIGVKKDYNPKGIGLLLHSYSIQYQSNPSEEIKGKLDFLFNWLVENPTKGFKGYCWGYNFDWASPKKLVKAFSPTIVVSGFIAKGIYAYYKATGNEKAVEILKEIGVFVLNELEVTEDKSGICFSYSTVEKDCCYNASMLGSELFAMLYLLTNEKRYLDLVIKSADFVVDKQKDSGLWNYSVDLETGKERKQVDFHQGYVIDNLAQVINYVPSLKERYLPHIKKGLTYYRENQFLSNGQSLYRIPSKWPVEIHNQAQGIISFSRLQLLEPEYLDFAKKIANYTLQNMFSSRGYFFYKKYPMLTIKTPFMRWSQAWMFLALNELELAIKKASNK